MKTFFASAAIVAASVIASTAGAASVTLELTTEFSGGTNPTGSAPWGTATFTDVAANTVSLSLTRSSTLSASEFIRVWLFNLNPALSPASLGIVQGSGPVSTNAVRTGADNDNAFRGDGGSFFDFKFEWPTTNDANRFDSDWTTANYTLSMAGLDATDFLDLGFGAGNSPNGLYTAAHIQGIPPQGGSGWVTGGPVLVPLPGAAWAGMSGFAVVAAYGVRRRGRQQD